MTLLLTGRVIWPMPKSDRILQTHTYVSTRWDSDGEMHSPVLSGLDPQKAMLFHSLLRKFCFECGLLGNTEPLLTCCPQSFWYQEKTEAWDPLDF